MNRDQRLDYIEFPATDFAAIEAFYGSVFGWKFESYGDAYLAFTEHRLEGGFYKAEPNLKSRQDNGATLAVFYADSLEETLGRVEAAGGQVSRPIFEFPGGRRFHFTDPHGNELAVWSDQ